MKTVRGIIAQYMVHTTDDIEGLAKEIDAYYKSKVPKKKDTKGISAVG